MLRIKNTTGLPRDTKVLAGGKDVTDALSVKSITVHIDAGGEMTANLQCHVEECDLSVLPQSVSVSLDAKIGLDINADDVMDKVKNEVAKLSDEDIDALRQSLKMKG